MARDAHKFKLGVFVLSGLALLLGGIVVLGAGSWFRESVTMYCYFDTNVSGLDEGSQIRYRGVNVGVVDDVRLVSTGDPAMGKKAPIEVRCLIYPDLMGSESRFMVTQSEFNADLQTRVGQGLRVSLAIKDITMQKYLAIDYFRPSEQPIPDMGVPTKQPYLPTAQEASLADMQRDLASTLAQLARVDYEKMSAQIVDLLEITTHKIESIDTQALSGHAEEAMIAVRRLAEDPGLHAAIGRLDSISARAESAVTRVDDLLSKPELEAVIDDAAATIRSLQATARSIEESIPQLVERVDQLLATADLELQKSDLAGTTESLRLAAGEVGDGAADIARMRSDLQRAMLQFGRASRSIDRLARSLDEDPGALIRGRGSKEN